MCLTYIICLHIDLYLCPDQAFVASPFTLGLSQWQKGSKPFLYAKLFQHGFAGHKNRTVPTVLLGSNNRKLIVVSALKSLSLYILDLHLI